MFAVSDGGAEDEKTATSFGVRRLDATLYPSKIAEDGRIWSRSAHPWACASPPERLAPAGPERPARVRRVRRAGSAEEEGPKDRRTKAQGSLTMRSGMIREDGSGGSPAPATGGRDQGRTNPQNHLRPFLLCALCALELAPGERARDASGLGGRPDAIAGPVPSLMLEFSIMLAGIMA